MPEALQLEHERFHRRFEAVSAGIVIHGVNGAIIHANDAACRILGLTQHEITGRTSFQPERTAIHEDGSLFPGDEHPAMETLRTGQPVREVVMGVYCPRTDGYRWILINSEPLLERATRKLYEVVVTFVDITKRVQAEQREKELEEHKLDFYRRTIVAATGGKLVITERPEIDKIIGREDHLLEFSTVSQLSGVRSAVMAWAKECGMESGRLELLLTCVGEATSNAVKHAHGGRVSLRPAGDRVMVRVDDDGPGIEALNLPYVALTLGYTTAQTGGLGYKMILASADKVYLATGSDGTTVAFEVVLR